MHFDKFFLENQRVCEREKSKYNACEMRIERIRHTGLLFGKSRDAEQWTS